MKKGKRPDLPSEVVELKERVEEWRRTRTVLSPMPAELWDAAAELARKHGVWRIATELRLGYTTLKKRMLSAEGVQTTSVREGGGFVEVPVGGLLGGVSLGGAVVEFSPGDGSRLTIRLSPGDRLDVVSLIRALGRTC